MKMARWYGILYLSFLLWMLLFPPWRELSGRFIENNVGEHFHPYAGIGHHWRFSVPLHWQWSYYEQKSSLVPNLKARIDYLQMVYEAAIGFVALALLFLLLPALEMPIRKITTCTKVEIILMGTRIRNWRNQHRKTGRV
jgi:multisubunit Na+/H+ antiporter MnhB subunit